MRNSDVIFVPPLEEGKYKLSCPKCGGERCLSVDVGEQGAAWFCHRVHACDFKGTTRGFIKSRKRKHMPVLDFVEGYSPHPLRDSAQQVRGWVHYADDKNTTPKRLTYKDPDWCGLHFPGRVVENRCLLVEDWMSAEKMWDHFPTVSLQGVYLSPEMIEHLYEIGINHCVVALDNDATVQAIRMHRLMPIVKDVIMLPCDIKDMDDKALFDIAQNLRNV